MTTAPTTTTTSYDHLLREVAQTLNATGCVTVVQARTRTSEISVVLRRSNVPLWDLCQLYALQLLERNKEAFNWGCFIGTVSFLHTAGKADGTGKSGAAKLARAPVVRMNPYEGADLDLCVRQFRSVWAEAARMANQEFALLTQPQAAARVQDASTSAKPYEEFTVQLPWTGNRFQSAQQRRVRGILEKGGEQSSGGDEDAASRFRSPRPTAELSPLGSGTAGPLNSTGISTL